MSDATTQRLKVSREGMVLIKSFEGFRPRAVAGDNGGWVIGYGHTLSAREGASVSEADAELLLQYDLLPVVKMLNDQAPGLNQHQFDALASFAFSIGVDRFMASDVARRVSSGALGEAADALIGWPEPTPPDAALRRRAAERALFVADPSHAVTLADLLAAPLPPPEVVTPVFETPSPIAARAAAVATLLGETVVEPEAEAAPEPEGAPAPGPASTTNLAASFQFQRFSPYAASVVGPLPGLGQAASLPAADLNSHVAIAQRAAVTSVEPIVEALVEPEPTIEPASAIEPEVAPERAVETEPRPAEDVFPPVVTTAVEPLAPTGPLLTPAVDAPAPPLVLTALSENDAFSAQRPVWGEQQRETVPVDQDALFEDEPVEVSILRHEEIIEPRRFDSAQAAFMIMGSVGLASCTASAAAFRQAIEDSSGLNDYTLLGWTLGVIGVVCVVASAANLYPRLFPHKDK